MLTVALIFFQGQGPFIHLFYTFMGCLVLLTGAKANPAVTKTELSALM